MIQVAVAVLQKKLRCGFLADFDRSGGRRHVVDEEDEVPMATSR